MENNRSFAEAEASAKSVGDTTLLRRGRRTHVRTAMALVGTMLVLMLILAVSLVGVAKSGQSSGDLGSTSNNMIQMAKLRIRTQKAETIADAGFRASVQWISDLAGPPVNTAAFTPKEVTPTEFYAGTGRVDSGKWTVVNFPDTSDATQGQFKVRFYPHKDNATASQRAYLVEVVGMVEGISRVVRADIKQKNFAQYAYFADNLGSGGFVAGRTTFNGPVHINNSNGKDLAIIWDKTLTPDVSRLFQWDGDNSFTMWSNGGSNNSKVKWYINNNGNTTPSTPTSDTDWKSIITPKQTVDASGNVTGETARTGPTMTDDKVDMPKNSFEQRDAALGGQAESVLTSKTEGVYVPTDGGADASSGTPVGGVYIMGQVDDMVLEAAGTGNVDQIVHVYQNNHLSKYTLRMNTNGTTTVTRYTRTATNQPFVVSAANGYPKAFSGAPTNGVIYTHDDIGRSDGTGGISGTVADSESATALKKLNICTRIEDGNQKTLNVDGNILYANATGTATVAPDTAGVLGLVAGNIRIVTAAKVEESAVTGFETKDAAGNVIKDGSGNPVRRDGYYADGSAITDLSVHATMMSYNTITIDAYDTRAIGRFRLLGGYIAQVGSPFGTTKGGTAADAFDVTHGFDRVLNYDKRVANQPPPYFPGTGQAYEIVSYQRLLQPLYP